MLKLAAPYLTYLILSMLVIMFSQYTHEAASYVVDFYNYIDNHISVFFSHSVSGVSLRHVIALIICPLIITGVPALVYQAICRKPLPYFRETTWLLWLIIVLSNLLVR